MVLTGSRRRCVVVIVAAVMATRCRAIPSAAELRMAAQQKEFAALEAKRQDRIQELNGMGLPRLVDNLVMESRLGKEPFNSMAYEETVRRGPSAVPGLKSQVSTRDASALLPLFALREISNDAYNDVDAAARIAILVDSLRTAKYFNLWGIPHLFWEDAAKTLIAEGKGAEGPLVALLGDRREADIWGSEGVAEQRQYRYRVCDYAWALLNEIRGTKEAIPVDPAVRDQLIASSQRP
jgi:hypothetical protein